MVRYDSSRRTLRYYINCDQKPEKGFIRVNSVNLRKNVIVKVYVDVPEVLFHRKWDPYKHFEGSRFGNDLIAAKPLANLLHGSTFFNQS